MTDQHQSGHGGHGGHTGGHEIDAPPTRELFNIVWGLGALTLLSLITCTQLFYGQARDVAAERGKEGSQLLATYRKDMEARTRGTGQEQLTGPDGKVVARYSYVPLASARDLILAKPERLQAFQAPPGWIHPDDIAAGGQGAASAVPGVPTPAPGPEMGSAPAPANPPAEGSLPAPGTPSPATPTEMAPTPGTSPTGAAAGAKDEGMPLNVDKGQSESTKQVPGGTVEPVGAKSPPVDAKGETKAEAEAPAK